MSVRPKHVFRWDLDKTYLRTEFDSLGDLWQSAMESATDKVAYPGAAALMRALRRSSDHRICIVSGSPSQMRKVLTAKLALDGIEFDEFVLKNNLRNLLKMRFRALRSQVPFKLPALLESRSNVVGDARETLFGDDSEADGVIYSLYADILAGTVDIDELRRCLDAARSYPDQVERTLALAEQVQGKGDFVQRILIHLDKRSPTARFSHFGNRLVPIYNYLQGALVLFRDGLVDAAQILFVADEMLASKEYQVHTLANSFQDLLRRGRIDHATAKRLVDELQQQARGARDAERAAEIEHLRLAFAGRLADLGGAAPLEWPTKAPDLDYVGLIDAEYSRKRRDHR